MEDDADIDTSSLQTSAANINYFQGWANRVTTADPVNTHGYRNHVCSRGKL